MAMLSYMYSRLMQLYSGLMERSDKWQSVGLQDQDKEIMQEISKPCMM